MMEQFRREGFRDDFFIDSDQIDENIPQILLQQVEATYDETVPGFQPDQECTVCYESLINTKVAPMRCKHIFHTACIEQWLLNNLTCPVCR